MSKETDLGRRESFWQIPLCFLSLSLTPSFLIPETKAADLKYPSYNTPDEQTLERILLVNNFPQSFDFKYVFPRNTDLFGDTAKGHFLIKKTPKIMRLQITADHPKEKRNVQLAEVIKGDIIDYFEKDVDFGQNNLVLYENKDVYPLNRNQPKITTVLRDFFDGNLRNSHFMFQGKNYMPREYFMEINDLEDEKYDYALEVKIKGEGVRAPKLKVFFEKHKGFDIPVEIWADYKIKVPFPFSLIPFCKYDTHTLRAVLTENV